MLDAAVHEYVASLCIGTPSNDVARRLLEFGITKIPPGEAWAIRISGGIVDTIVFTAGFPADVPIQQLLMGESRFKRFTRTYPDAGVIVSSKSPSGRNPYFVDLPEQGAEMLVELGERSELVKIVLEPRGRFREKAPGHWQKMTDFMQARAAKEAEARRRAQERRPEIERQRALAARVAAIADPDAQLDAWAAETHLWGEPAPWLVPYAAWLRAGGPERWYEAAMNWNWDHGTIPLRWIVTRPQCDAATALAVFYAAEPDSQPDIGEVPELLALIRERWAAGAYARGELGFQPPSYDPDRHLDRVPLSMRAAIPGRSAQDTSSYYDGFPGAVLHGSGTKIP